MRPQLHYLNTILTALKITWQNKYLWILGFFATGLTLLARLFSYSDFNPTIYLETLTDFNTWKTYYTLFSDLLWIYPLRTTLVLVGFFLTGVIFLILGVLSQGGLIWAVDKIALKTRARLWLSLKATPKYFWRILGIDALFIFSLLIILPTFLGVPLWLWVVKERVIVASILGALGSIISFILVFGAIFILRYSVIFVVLADQSSLRALKSALGLFRRYIWETILINILVWAYDIILFLSLFFISFLLLIPLGMIILILWLLAERINPFFALLSASLIYIGVSFLVSAFISAFESGVWTLTFKQLKGNFRLK